MYLKSINVKNFRNLCEFSLNLQPGLNVLVGRNNMGKSNLLDAIRLALGPSSTKHEAIWLNEDDFFRSNSGKRQEVIKISLEYADLSEDQIAQFFEISEPVVADLSKSTASVHFEAVWRQNDRRPHTNRWGGALRGERTAIPAEILEQLPVTYLPALREAQAALAPGPRSRIAQLLKDLSVDQDKQAITKLFQDANTSLSQQPLVEKVASRGLVENENGCDLPFG